MNGAHETVALLGPYLAILIGAALPTHVWRWLGVLLSGQIDDGGEVFVLVKAIATALVAALISKLLLHPTGPLADTPVGLRIGAAALGFGAYLLAGKRLGVAVLVAEVTLIGGWLALG